MSTACNAKTAPSAFASVFEERKPNSTKVLSFRNLTSAMEITCSNPAPELETNSRTRKNQKKKKKKNATEKAAANKEAPQSWNCTRQEEFWLSHITMIRWQANVYPNGSANETYLSSTCSLQKIAWDRQSLVFCTYSSLQKYKNAQCSGSEALQTNERWNQQHLAKKAANLTNDYRQSEIHERT